MIFSSTETGRKASPAAPAASPAPIAPAAPTPGEVAAKKLAAGAALAAEEARRAADEATRQARDLAAKNAALEARIGALTPDPTQPDSIDRDRRMDYMRQVESAEMAAREQSRASVTRAFTGSVAVTELRQSREDAKDVWEFQFRTLAVRFEVDHADGVATARANVRPKSSEEGRFLEAMHALVAKGGVLPPEDAVFRVRQWRWTLCTPSQGVTHTPASVAGLLTLDLIELAGPVPAKQ